jgi:hypothetical protein
LSAKVTTLLDNHVNFAMRNHSLPNLASPKAASTWHIDCARVVAAARDRLISYCLNFSFVKSGFAQELLDPQFSWAFSSL